jgi:hypothetical protein
VILESLPQLLIGEIADEHNVDEKGWYRRRISLKKGNSGSYPQVGDTIILIDTYKNQYTHKFIKGFKRDRVYTSRPANLKTWFVAHYDTNKLEKDQIYLDLQVTDQSYRLYTSTEWKHKQQITQV